MELVVLEGILYVRPKSCRRYYIHHYECFVCLNTFIEFNCTVGGHRLAAMFIRWRLVCIVLVTLVARSENIEAGDGDLVSLLGSGASFPDRLYMEWGAAFKAYRNEQNAKLKTTYESIGSGAGNEVFIDRIQKTHYAGSDLLLTDKKYEQDTDLQMFPTCAG